jgi:hypothetical protein
VQAAAAAAAAAAVPEPSHDVKRGTKNIEKLTESQKKKLNRERNKEHAKSTRARKKAYINKLKELVDGLHTEQATEATNRRVQVQQLADVQRTRRSVLQQFLKYHGGYESNPRKWATIVEDNFVLKQPVTPYRSFRRSEIENSRDRECRKSVGIDAVIADSASISVMVESVGSRSSRWKNIKRDYFLRKEEIRTGKVRPRMPRQIERQYSRLHHAVSSLSSSSAHSHSLSSGNGSGNGSGEEEEEKKKFQSAKRRTPEKNQDLGSPSKRKKVSCSSSSGTSGLNSSEQALPINTEYHDYNAKPLPDPKLDRGSSADTASAGSDSLTENDSDNAVVGRDMGADSSSGDEINPPRPARQKRQVPPTLEIPTENGPSSSKSARTEMQSFSTLPVSDPSTNSSMDNVCKDIAQPRSGLPPNIAQSGGIVHNVQVGSINPRLNSAPAISLPPFTGLGRQSNVSKANPSNNTSISLSHSSNSDVMGNTGLQSTANPISNSLPTPIAPASNIIGENNDGSSDESTSSQILAFFHVNQDDMLLMDDILMCPFIFRTQDAVLCGALAECVMPGMLRAQFSPMNKLVSLEMVYDAMGFMQQLGRASGDEGFAEIIPNSLEMSLQPSNNEARVITTAKPPFSIVSANSAWTRITKYSQMEAEQKELTILDGKRTFHGAKNRPRKPSHDFSAVAAGRSGCSTNVFYDKYGKSFVAFVSSYPLTNAQNEVTHLLHVYKSLHENSN